MPTRKTQSTLARQWELLKLLPSRGTGKTAKQLAEALNDAGFKISKRQVERDLADLYDAFKLDCNNSSLPYGWRLPTNAAIDLPGITLAEALSLQLVEDTLKTLMPVAMMKGLEPRFHQAKRKLNTLEPELETAQWLNKVAVTQPAMPLIPPSINPNILEVVQDALLENRQLTVSYKKLTANQASEQTLHPLGLVQRGATTYLVATAFDYSDAHLYAMHRIIDATKTNQTATIPANFKLTDFIDQGALQFGNKHSIQLKAQLVQDLAQVLMESPLSENQTLEFDGTRYQLSATVYDTWQLRWWILSHGAEIEILAPTVLRHEIAQTLQQAANQYTENQ